MLGVVLELQFSKARIQDLELSCVCFSNQSSYEWGLIALNKIETLNNLILKEILNCGNHENSLMIRAVYKEFFDDVCSFLQLEFSKASYMIINIAPLLQAKKRALFIIIGSSVLSHPDLRFQFPLKTM